MTGRILTLDIETRPHEVYAWNFWDVNVSPDQIIQEGGTICFGAKWYGEDEPMIFYSDWQHGHEYMIEKAHSLMSEADAIVTYNGDRFDLPKLYGEFVLADLSPPPPWTSIDLLKAVKKFGFGMNRLAVVGPKLGIGEKVKHEGFRLWVEVLEGNEDAQKRMQEYCEQDVKLTEDLYDRVRPYIRDHPHMGEQGANTCGACGSNRLQRRGFRRTRCFHIQRLQCQDCGSWMTGTRKKVK